jgi:hypothetical protein
MGNGAIRPLAKIRPFRARVIGIVDATEPETTAHATGLLKVICEQGGWMGWSGVLVSPERL